MTDLEQIQKNHGNHHPDLIPDEWNQYRNIDHGESGEQKVGYLDANQIMDMPDQLVHQTIQGKSNSSLDPSHLRSLSNLE